MPLVSNYRPQFYFRAVDGDGDSVDAGARTEGGLRGTRLVGLAPHGRPTEAVDDDVSYAHDVADPFCGHCADRP